MFGIPLVATVLHQWCNWPLSKPQTLVFQWHLWLFYCVRLPWKSLEALNPECSRVAWEGGYTPQPQRWVLNWKIQSWASLMSWASVCLNRSNYADTLLLSLRWLEKMFTSTWLERSRHVHIPLLSPCTVLTMTPSVWVARTACVTRSPPPASTAVTCTLSVAPFHDACGNATMQL